MFDTLPMKTALGGDTRDLIVCVRLTDMPAATRSLTVAAIRAVRAALAPDGGEIPYDDFAAALDQQRDQIKGAIGERATQTLSDARRAVRLWEHAPRRALAIRLRDRLPTLADAVAAAKLTLPDDVARRVETAADRLAASLGDAPDRMVATTVVIEPLLKRATPETFEVSSGKSLDNRRAEIRRAVRLVDPVTSGGRVADIGALPPAWRDALAAASAHLSESAKGPRAILRRLAASAADAGHAPNALPECFVAGFLDQERVAKAEGYIEKIRAAVAAWNGAAGSERLIAMIDMPKGTTVRQAAVSWTSVPAAIREPLDTLLATAVSARNPGDWSRLVPCADDHDDYAELGLGALAHGSPVEAFKKSGARILEVGTQRNLRDAVKRAWRAALDDNHVKQKPTKLGDLFRRDIAVAMVAGARAARRARCEAEGRDFDAGEKARYEHTLVEALCAVGRALGIDTARLAPIEEFKRDIDPAVIGHKMGPDGALKRIYAKRRIGKRHAEMLRPFASDGPLRRWFEAPGQLWDLAMTPVRQGRKPTEAHVALARNALIARISQCSGPLRRANLARIRHQGPDAHLQLPVGDGWGTMHIPAIEAKTWADITLSIDPDTVAMLKFYIATFLPIAHAAAGADPANTHLWPGNCYDRPEGADYAPGMGYVGLGPVNRRFKKHMRKHARLNLCLHVMRHLSAKVILDQDPSSMALVQALLGHWTISTTQAYYAEVNAIIAQRHYISLLDAATRKVLANVKFRLHVLDTMKRKR